MLNSLRKSENVRRAASSLHAAIVARARAPVFYAELGVADSVDGRFDLIALHAWLVLERLRSARLNDLSQALTDALFVGFDEGLRDLGAGDMGLGRRMKKIADAFYGRLKVYGESADEGSMGAALARNLYRGARCGRVTDVARYVLAAKEYLAHADIASGIADFGPPP
jgi:cytochrome b pre-mRNA-processing protein 3